MNKIIGIIIILLLLAIPVAILVSLIGWLATLTIVGGITVVLLLLWLAVYLISHP